LSSEINLLNPSEGMFADIIFEPSTGAIASDFSLDIVSTRNVSLTNAVVVSTLGAVNVIATSTQTTSPPPPESPIIVYDDSLTSPWWTDSTSVSWNSYIDIQNTNPVIQGTYSINASSTDGWSALLLRSGLWGSGVPVDFQDKIYLQFKAYGDTGGTPIHVDFANDSSNSFPDTCFTGVNEIPGGIWTTYSIPLTNLNPSNLVVHTIRFKLWTNIMHKWFIDEIKFAVDDIPGAITPPTC